MPGLLELILNVGLSEVHTAFRLANDRLSEPRLVVQRGERCHVTDSYTNEIS